MTTLDKVVDVNRADQLVELNRLDDKTEAASTVTGAKNFDRKTKDRMAQERPK